MIDRVIAEAEGKSRPVVIVPTASTAKSFTARIEAPAEARSTAAALEPQPFAPDRLAAAGALETALGRRQGRPSIVWLSDDIDHDGKAAEVADKLRGLAAGRHLRRHRGRPRDRAARRRRPASARAASSKRACCAPTGGARNGFVHAISTRGQSLAEAPFKFAAGASGDDRSVRAAARVAQPGRPRRDRRRALGRRRQPHRRALAVASRGAHLGREPRAGAAAAGPALLHREGAQAVRRADQAARAPTSPPASRKRCRRTPACSCWPTSARFRARRPSTSRTG